MNLRKWLGLLVVAWLLAGLFGSRPVSAQSSATIAVTPAAGDVILNQTRTINLWVTGGVNVNAFDVTVTYDPALVTLDSWSHGTYLSNLWTVYTQNISGTLRVAAAQLARPAVSGDGNLLNLTFRGSAYGISAITLTAAQFSTLEGVNSNPARQSGTLYVHGDPTGVPIFTVSGSLRLQGQTNAAGVPVSLGFGTLLYFGPYTATSTSLPAPNLTFSNVYQDTYRITTDQPRYLDLTTASNKTKSVAAGTSVISPLLLLGGNAVWRTQVGGVWVADDVIDTLDLALVAGQYGQTGSDLAGDVNFSGAVDFFDLVMVAGNYGLSSATAYGSWTP